MIRQHPDPSRFNLFAVEGVRTGANGVAPSADREEADPDWQPL